MSLKYLKQRSVSEKYRITLPEEVKEDLYPDENYNGTQVYWNTDKKNKDIIISTKWLKEDSSEFKKAVETHETGNSDKTNGSVTIVVEQHVRDEFDISMGDDLYFIAPEGVSDLTPATFIWTFEKLESIILSGDEEDLGDFPRQPHF